jgi:hypothetical protein
MFPISRANSLTASILLVPDTTVKNLFRHDSHEKSLNRSLNKYFEKPKNIVVVTIGWKIKHQKNAGRVQ